MIQLPVCQNACLHSIETLDSMLIGHNTINHALFLESCQPFNSSLLPGCNLCVCSEAMSAKASVQWTIFCMVTHASTNSCTQCVDLVQRIMLRLWRRTSRLSNHGARALVLMADAAALVVAREMLASYLQHEQPQQLHTSPTWMGPISTHALELQQKLHQALPRSQVSLHCRHEQLLNPVL